MREAHDGIARPTGQSPRSQVVRRLPPASQALIQTQRLPQGLRPGLYAPVRSAHYSSLASRLALTSNL